MYQYKTADEQLFSFNEIETTVKFQWRFCKMIATTLNNDN